MAHEPLRTVFKLGGSLLHEADWPSRLRTWMSRQVPGAYYGIVGGGMLIEALRILDQRHHLSQEDMHWRCIRTLDANFEIAVELIPEFEQVVSNDNFFSSLKTYPKADRPIAHWIRVRSFYAPKLLESVPAEWTPGIGWQTTSDALALFLAHLIGAKRCVLLKACDVSHIHSLSQAIDEALVDPEVLRYQACVPSIELERLPSY